MDRPLGERGSAVTEQTKRRTHLTAQIKPSTKHALMLWLARAADRIEEQAARLAWWEEHHEQAVADALIDNGMPRWLVLVLGALVGAAVVAIVEAIRA